MSVAPVSNTADRARDVQRTCVECRRRKVRCEYDSASASECARCLRRGIECIVPRPHGIDDPETEKRTLRDRVSKLESLVEQLSQQKTHKTKPFAAEPHLSNLDADESGDGLSDVARGAPLIAALEASELLSTRDGPCTTRFHPQQIGQGDNPSSTPFRSFKPKQDDAAVVCEKLRSALPCYEELRATLSRDSGWYTAWQSKTFGWTAPPETLLQYLDRVYSNGTVVQIGFVVSAVGRQNFAHAAEYLPLVDQLILADDRFASTLDALILAVFHAKVYLDIGQPHRAFLCNRRAISLAQTMNLHRTYATSNKRTIVWWSMYLGDRFCSILLGLPPAISDSHFTVTITQDPRHVGHASRPFGIQLAILTGRVIDQVQNRSGPKLSAVMDIEDELGTLASNKARIWWDYSVPSVASPEFMTDLRERLLSQTQYFMTRVYLHMPYLLKANASRLYQGSKEMGIDSARELILRYHALRSCIDNEPIFDCQSIDFVGFLGSVVLLLGTSPVVPPGDVAIISKTIDVLQMAAMNANQVAHQCGSTLSTLLTLCLPGKRDAATIPSTIRIPYFGVLRVTPPGQVCSAVSQAGEDAPTRQDDVDEATDTSLNVCSETIEPNPADAGMPTVVYDGPYDFDYSMEWTHDDSGATLDTMDLMPNLDLDWESFLNSGLQ